METTNRIENADDSDYLKSFLNALNDYFEAEPDEWAKYAEKIQEWEETDWSKVYLA